MNKNNGKKPATRSEYDFSGGVRGKYAARYARGTNIVMLNPDVGDVFTDSKAVNQALRAIAGIVRTQAKAAPAVRKRVKSVR